MNVRRAKYSAKKVYLPNASTLGFGVRYAKPGSWITWETDGCAPNTGRVLGRIDETARDGLENCDGWLAVMALSRDMGHAHVRWVNPADVYQCQESPPAALLAWITGEEWPTHRRDIPRLIAMSEHGTCSNEYIASRNDPAKPYNARPEYVAQFILGE
jgi:hypothetical protein